MHYDIRYTYGIRSMKRKPQTIITHLKRTDQRRLYFVFDRQIVRQTSNSVSVIKGFFL